MGGLLRGNWVAIVLSIVAIAISAKAYGETHGDTSCSDGLIAAPPLAELFDMKAVDRNNVLIGGRVAVDGNHVFLFMDWNEPLLIASGEPLRMAKNVKIARGAIVFTNAEVVPTYQDRYRMPY